jgi:hypothetical protein
MMITHQRPAGASGGARVPTSRELSRDGYNHTSELMTIVMSREGFLMSNSTQSTVGANKSFPKRSERLPMRQSIPRYAVGSAMEYLRGRSDNIYSVKGGLGAWLRSFSCMALSLRLQIGRGYIKL